MASTSVVRESEARNNLEQAKGILLVFLQENDEGRGGLVLTEWSEEVYQSVTHIEEALNHLDRAALL